MSITGLLYIIPLVLSATAEVEPAMITPVALYHKARMALYHEDRESAARLLRDFQSLYPDHPFAPEASVWEARVLLDLGKPAEARTKLDALSPRQLPPDLREEAAYLAARAAQEAGDEGAAMLKLLEVPPDSPLYGADALLMRLNLARGAGFKHEGWQNWLREFLRLYPADVRADDLKRAALAELDETGRGEAALDLYNELARQQNPAIGEGWAILEEVTSALRSDQLDRAVAATEAALDRVEEPGARHRLAVEAARRFRTEGALPVALAEIARLPPEEPGHSNRMERVATLIELVEGAISDASVQEAEATAGRAEFRGLPSLRDLHHLLLFYYARTDNREALNRWIEATLNRFPEDERSYELSAALYRRTGERDLSRRTLLQGLRLLNNESVKEEIEAALEGIRDASSLAPADMMGYAGKR